MPAGTVIVVRDGPAGLEALMVRRGAGAAFGPSAWVFPGGRVDPGDHDDGDDPDDEVAPARRAAARELVEEAGMVLDASSLVPWARFVPPPSAPIRYATWFFAAPAVDIDAVVVVDGFEVDDHRWLRPVDAMAARETGELSLMPPTWVALWHVAQHATVDELLAHLGATTPTRFNPKPIRHGTEMVMLYQGDAGYDTDDPTVDGAHHRLVVAETGWVYQRS